MMKYQNIKYERNHSHSSLSFRKRFMEFTYASVFMHVSHTAKWIKKVFVVLIRPCFRSEHSKADKLLSKSNKIRIDEDKIIRLKSRRKYEIKLMFLRWVNEKIRGELSRLFLGGREMWKEKCIAHVQCSIIHMFTHRTWFIYSLGNIHNWLGVKEPTKSPFYFVSIVIRIYDIPFVIDCFLHIVRGVCEFDAD